MPIATLKHRIAGKYRAAAALTEFARYFRNWREVWSAYRAGRRLPPLVFRNGLILHHGDADDPIFLFREIFVGACYAGDDFYRPTPADTVLDLGANIGAFALYLQSRARGMTVHCFEPASRTFALLARNVAENNLGATVTPHHVAVSDAPGAVRLKRGRSPINTSMFANDDVDSFDEESVPCVDLSGAIARAGSDRIDLLKVDVEGAEIEVVSGGDPSDWAKVRRVVLEYHDTFRPGSRDHVASALRDRGFSSVQILPAAHDPRLGYIRASRETGDR
jgi:FkbM family methyltransferase